MGKSSKLGPGPTGPRTPLGKERSSRNSIKHGLFSERVSPSEEKEAARLHRRLRKELHLNRFEDEFFGSGMVLDVLKNTHVDEYACEEQRKADWQAARDQMRKLECRWSSKTFPNRAHPDICVILLRNVKTRIEKRGLNPEEDLPILYSVFSRGDGELTFLGTSIILLYETLKCVGSKADEQLADSSAERQKRVLDLIEEAIKLEQSFADAEAMNESLEPSAVSALLPDAVADRILRSRAAIKGDFMWKLDALERYRRLRKCSSQRSSAVRTRS